MTKSLGICIEDLKARPGEPRYVRCVAVPGRQPGLRLDTGGEVLWKSNDDVACELWVSADDRLILYRPEGAEAVTVSRAGRSLDVPFGKPVVLIDQDQIDVGSRRLRVHVHGEARAVSAPSVLAPQQRGLADFARAAAVAATIGAAAVAGGCGQRRSTRSRQSMSGTLPPRWRRRTRLSRSRLTSRRPRTEPWRPSRKRRARSRSVRTHRTWV